MIVTDPILKQVNNKSHNTDLQKYKTSIDIVLEWIFNYGCQIWQATIFICAPEIGSWLFQYSCLHSGTFFFNYIRNTSHDR